MLHWNWIREQEGRTSAWMAEGDEAIRLRVEAGRTARERAKEEEDEEEEDCRIYMSVLLSWRPFSSFSTTFPC